MGTFRTTLCRLSVFQILLSSSLQVVTGDPFPFDLSTVRSYDGSDRNDNYGKAVTPLNRLVPATYPGDGTGSTTVLSPNARTISNVVNSQTSMILNDRNLNSMIWTFGQLLDHDMGLTEGASSFGRMDIDIIDGSSDPFTRANCASISMMRSDFVGSPRQQRNAITSFIDASFLYGSDQTRATRLRTGSDGLLLMTPGNGQEGRGLPPKNFEMNPLPNAGGDSPLFFISGDIRVNENVALTSMHTLFAREHNRLAKLIKNTWDDGTMMDEDIYQLARKIVGAEMQLIAFKEWLPAVMGTNDAPSLTDHTYSTAVDPRMLTEFTTAIFRFGHSMLQNALTLGYDKLSTTNLPLRDAFFNPKFLYAFPENVDLLLGGMMLDHAQEVDALITDEVRNFLFANRGQTACMDLAALNIQRGRDHGLPSYNTLRQAVNLPAKTSFDQITSNTNLRQRLQQAYGNDISKIDAWTGALAEDHRPGSSLGELMTKIFQMQFTRLRDGDPWFYLNDPIFATTDLKRVFDVDSFSFAKLLRDNTNIPNVPDNVFFIDDGDAAVCGSMGTISMELS